MAQEEKPVQTAAVAPANGNGPLPAGVYLQLGAFANADNADNLKNHLGRELDWLAEPMRVVPGNGIHRIQVGPYTSRADADRVAERIRSSHGFKPTVVIR